jgi:hypothetical protein
MTERLMGSSKVVLNEPFDQLAVENIAIVSNVFNLSFKEIMDSLQKISGIF